MGLVCLVRLKASNDAQVRNVGVGCVITHPAEVAEQVKGVLLRERETPEVLNVEQSKINESPRLSCRSKCDGNCHVIQSKLSPRWKGGTKTRIFVSNFGRIQIMLNG